MSKSTKIALGLLGLLGVALWLNRRPPTADSIIGHMSIGAIPTDAVEGSVLPITCTIVNSSTKGGNPWAYIFQAKTTIIGTKRNPAKSAITLDGGTFREIAVDAGATKTVTFNYTPPLGIVSQGTLFSDLTAVFELWDISRTFKVCPDITQEFVVAELPTVPVATFNW
jgi:hypothetical protein